MRDERRFTRFEEAQQVVRLAPVVPRAMPRSKREAVWRLFTDVLESDEGSEVDRANFREQVRMLEEYEETLGQSFSPAPVQADPRDGLLTTEQSVHARPGRIEDGPPVAGPSIGRAPYSG